MRDVRALIVSAPFWCVLLTLLGAVSMAVGVSIAAGMGYGLVTFGALCLIAANVLRQGLTRV